MPGYSDMGLHQSDLKLGRYENFSVEDRLCHVCQNNSVEDEVHVAHQGPVFDDLRKFF